MCKIYNDSYQNNIANKCRMQTHIPVTFLLALERVPGRPYVAIFRSIWLIRVEYFPNSFGIRARIREREREKKSDCLWSIEDPAWVTLCDGWEWLTKAKLCFWKHKQDGFSIKYSSSTTRVYYHFFLSLSVSRPFFVRKVFFFLLFYLLKGATFPSWNRWVERGTWNNFLEIDYGTMRREGGKRNGISHFAFTGAVIQVHSRCLAPLPSRLEG